MGNFKETRKRIATVISTQQITRAMKMVSASKLRKAQDAIIKIRPYSFKLKEVMSSLSDGMDDLSLNPYFSKRPVKKVLIISLAGNKGLSGSYNSNIIKETLREIKKPSQEREKDHKVDLILIGKKINDYFKKTKLPVIKSYSSFADHMDYESVSQIVEDIEESFKNKEYDLVLVVYNNFKNPVVYDTTVEQFLPILPSEIKSDDTTIRPYYIFEPCEGRIVNSIIPRFLYIHFLRMVLESHASLHGATMTAMEKATENANELLDTLKLTYNKERQASITKEILEIVSGANALKQ